MIGEEWRTGVAVDVLGYVSERVVRLVLAAAVGILVARYLGPDGYGLLNYAGGVYGLLGPLTLLGMQQVLLREFSTREDWRPVLTSALASQVPVAAVASAIGFAVIVATRAFEREAVLLALVMLPLPLLGLNETVRTYLEAIGRVRRIVVTGLAAGLIASSLKLAGVVIKAPIWVFGAFGTVEVALVLVGIIGAIPGRSRAKALRQHFELSVATRLLRESWPLLLSAIAVTVYMRADLLMLGMIAGDRETGIYAAAARLSEVWYFIPVSAAAAIRPRLARMYAAGEFIRYRASTQRFMTAAVGISVAVLAFVFVLANWIIELLYGPEFLEASLVLRIHILSAPFVFLGVAGSQWFIDRGMTRAVMFRSSLGAVLNVVTNFILIPRYGASGASVATLIAYASGVLINVIPVRTRPLFWLQMRACLLKWPHTSEASDEATSTSDRSDP